MTAGELYELLLDRASRTYDRREAEAVSRYIMKERFGIDRLRLVLEKERELGEPEGLNRLLLEVEEGRPVQYITGTAWFCGLELPVREGVLIPRPETEELVEWIVNESPAEPAILDIGTGSGAIAIALSSKIRGSAVTATDISAEALRIAQSNAVSAGAGVLFVENDILQRGGHAGIAADGGYDIIVSNPPYIPESEEAAMHRNVTGHEPRGALFVPDGEPLLFYKAIAGFAYPNLKTAGRLYFEVHENFACDVALILSGEGFTDVVIRNDMHGKARMVRAVKR